MGDSDVLRTMTLNVGGRALERVPLAVALVPGLEMYGFLETMHHVGNCRDLDNLVEGYAAWHCVRPAPAIGRQHGGVTVYIRRDFAARHGCLVRCEETTGIIWVNLPACRVTVAVCYFSPAYSPVYNHGFLHTDPVQCLFAGIQRASSQGHNVVVMGDLNIRVGGLAWDVPDITAPLPPFVAPEMLSVAEADLEGIPHARASMDRAVPDPDSASQFMQGLCSSRMVLLNGRAPPPVSSALPGGGNARNDTLTCHVPGGGGGSVVDFALTSRGLFARVSSFEVMPFRTCLSRDHSAIVLQLQLPPWDAVANAGAARGRRVCRPQRDRYAAALVDCAACFQDLLSTWRQGGTSAATAHSQLVSMIRQAARACGGVQGAAVTRQGGNQPWFDAECQAAKHALQQACLQAHHGRGGGVGEGDADPAALAALHVARRSYKAVIAAKKQAYYTQQQVNLIETYFSQHQRDYWRVLFGPRHAACPVDDVSEWTEWFSNLLGSQPASVALTAEQQCVKQQLYEACSRLSQEDAEVLNSPLSLEEVACAMCLATGRAADLQGLTGEAIRVAAEVPEDQGEYVCKPFVECMQWLLQRLLDGTAPTDMMCTSKITPVPKSGQQQAPHDKNMYRGVCVSEVVSKVWDRVMFKRLEGVVEGHSLRAPTQCGFRAGHGTVDALFTMQHLLDKYRAGRRPLYVVFVDFKKAFDLVRRDLLLERCRELGVHGAFLQSLTALYDKMQLRVCVAGTTGEAFPTFMGTKQGSELSPLLFGLFIELLHELIQLKVPGAGPLLSTMRVPDVLYADDCALVAQSPAVCQQLLDVLDVFCQLFDMRVNLAPHKTCAVVFRPANMEVPATCRFTFQGQEVPMQDTYTYLGVLLHAHQGLACAPAMLAGAGRRALQAMLGQLRRARLSQFDIRCRMFDILVEPVMSYGCHVWGPTVCHNRMVSADRPVFMSDAEKVHVYFLRMMTGTGKGCIDVLLRDMHRAPIMHHWLVLAARWWTRLAAMPPDQVCMARDAWLSDIALMRGSETAGRVYRKCWSYRLLHCLEQIGAISAADWGPTVDLTTLRFDEAHIKQRLAQCLHARWAAVAQEDPRVAPTVGVEKCAHANWVYAVDNTVDCTDRRTAPLHMVLCAPTVHLRTLAQLRLGWAHLQVELGRRQRPSVPREQRVCRVCCGASSPAAWRQLSFSRCNLMQGTALGPVEDLRHFVLECPAYDEIRQSFALLPSQPWATSDPCACMRGLFACDNQSALASMLFGMKQRRAHLLGIRV